MAINLRTASVTKQLSDKPRLHIEPTKQKSTTTKKTKQNKLKQKRMVTVQKKHAFFSKSYFSQKNISRMGGVYLKSLFERMGNPSASLK